MGILENGSLDYAVVIKRRRTDSRNATGLTPWSASSSNEQRQREQHTREISGDSETA